MTPSKYDLILYGASGFTGKQTVDYCKRFAPPGLRWAIAGRNRAKLDAVNTAGVDALVADAQDDAALDRLTQQTAVVASTAGPFSIYGSKLVAAFWAVNTGQRRDEVSAARISPGLWSPNLPH